MTQARLVTPLGVLSFDSFFSFSFFYFSCSLRSLLFLIFRHILTMIHLHHSTAFKNHLIDKKKSANNNNNNGSPIKTLKDALACSRLRESRVREMHEEKTRTRKLNKRKPPPAPFPRSRAHIFACPSRTRHPYYVRACSRIKTPDMQLTPLKDILLEILITDTIQVNFTTLLRERPFYS